MYNGDKIVAGLLLFFLAVIIGACVLLIMLVNANHGVPDFEDCVELSGHFVCR